MVNVTDLEIGATYNDGGTDMVIIEKNEMECGQIIVVSNSQAE